MSKKKSLEELLEEALVPEEEQPYEVPDNWVWCKLGKISKINMGQSPRGEYTSENPDGMPLIGGPADMGSTIPNISRYTSKPTKISQVNDLIVSIRATIGKTNYADKEYCLGRGVAALSSCNVDVKLLKCFIDNNIDYLYEVSSGSTFAQITKNNLNSLAFPLPPIPEQKRIVKKVESMFTKIDKAKEQIEEARETFENRKASILAKAFRGELTKKWREDNSDVGGTEELYNIIQTSSGLGIEPPPYQLPEQWKWVTLDQVAIITMGQSPKSSTYNDEGIGTPLINGPVEFGPGHFSKTICKKWTTSPTKVCDKGDLLLCVRGSTLGRTNIAGFDACIGRGVAAVKALVNQEYINYLIHSMRENIFTAGSGTTFPNISKGEIQKMPIPLCSSKEQSVIVKILDKIDNIETKIEELTQLEEQIEQLKKSVLAKAFRGELGTNNGNDESAVELLREVLKKN